MARLIAATGVVAYNGITFPSALHTKIIARPAYQHGEVSRKYVNYSLMVDTMLTYTDPPLSAAVTANQNMGSNSIQYRKLLTEPRKTLQFGEQGFGEILVNGFASGTTTPAGYRSVRDVAFGPKPRMLTWEPVGSNRAAHVTWTCDFCIPECLSNSAKDRNVILEITYESIFNVNEEGLLTRTTRATIEIASNAQGSNFLDSVDNYTERFSPPRIDGFHRETNRHIERDHRIMQITYTDTEIASDNPFYPGMVQMDASHTVGSSFMQEGFARWTNTMTGTFRWGRGVPTSLAWAYFAALVQSRFAKNKPGKLFNTDKLSSTVSRANIPLSIQVTEQIYNREASFTIAWASMVPLAEMIDGTGLFTKVPNVSWANWHASLNQIQSPFGGSGLKEKIADIKVVDVCTNQKPGLPNNELLPPTSLTPNPWLGFSCSDVTPTQSWLDSGSPTVRLLMNGSPVQQLPSNGTMDSLLSPPPASTAGTQGMSPASTVIRATAAALYDQATYQSRTPNEFMLEVTGTFVRICYEPYAPVFKSYGNVPLILRDNEFKITKTPGQFFPIYTLAYRQTYYLERLPKGNTLVLLEHDAGKGDR